MRQNTLNGAVVVGYQQLLFQVVFPEDPQNEDPLLFVLDYCGGVGGPGGFFSDVCTQEPENRFPPVVYHELFCSCGILDEIVHATHTTLPVFGLHPRRLSRLLLR